MISITPLDLWTDLIETVGPITDLITIIDSITITDITGRITGPLTIKILENRAPCVDQNHKTADCKNIRDDSGTILEMHPTYQTCAKMTPLY
jgi:hypothetical protein